MRGYRRQYNGRALKQLAYFLSGEIQTAMTPTRAFRCCSTLIVILVLAHPAFSGIRPSFRLDYSSWHATHIVLVAIAFPRLKYFEGPICACCWVGQRVVVPELCPSSKALPIPLYPKSWSEAVAGGVTEMIPKLPAGSRMILFVKSEERQKETNKTGKTEHSWTPADIFGEMKTSVLWIDGDHAYQFVQVMNPGPSIFFEFPGSEQKVRDRATEIDGAQKELTMSVAARAQLEPSVSNHTCTQTYFQHDCLLLRN